MNPNDMEQHPFKATPFARQLQLDLNSTVSPLTSPAIAARIEGLSVNSPLNNILGKAPLPPSPGTASSASEVDVDGEDDDDSNDDDNNCNHQGEPSERKHNGKIMSFSVPPTECNSPASSPRDKPKSPSNKNVGRPPLKGGAALAQINGMTVKDKPRKRVKTACTNCKLAKTKCDKMRPCGRCKKRGQEHCCVDTVHKRRGRRNEIDESPVRSRSQSMSPTKRTSSYQKRQTSKTPRSMLGKTDAISPLAHSGSWVKPSRKNGKINSPKGSRGSRPQTPRKPRSPAKNNVGPNSPSSGSRSTVVLAPEQKSSLSQINVVQSPFTNSQLSMAFGENVFAPPPPSVVVGTFNDLLLASLNDQLQAWRMRTSSQAIEASKWLSSALRLYLEEVMENTHKSPHDRETLYQRQQIFLSQKLAACGFDSDKSANERMSIPVAMHAAEPLPFLGTNKVWLNRSACQALGYHDHEVYELNSSKRAFFSLFDISNLENYIRAFVEAISNGIEHYAVETKWVHKNGDRIEFREDVRIHYENGAPLYISSFLEPRRSSFPVKQAAEFAHHSVAQEGYSLVPEGDFSEEHKTDMERVDFPNHNFSPPFGHLPSSDYLVPMSTSSENLLNSASHGDFGHQPQAPFNGVCDPSWNVHVNTGDSNSVVDMDMSGPREGAGFSESKDAVAIPFQIQAFEQQQHVPKSTSQCSLSAMQAEPVEPETTFPDGANKERKISPKSRFVTSLLS